MKTNAEWILQLHSKDDHLVPVSAARFVAEKVCPIICLPSFCMHACGCACVRAYVRDNIRAAHPPH